MKKIFTAASSALLFLFVGSGAALAQDDGDEPSIAPVEIWACSYNDGKGPGDLNAVVEEWNEWMDDEDQNNYFAALLTPTFYGEHLFDVAWLGVYPDGNQMGAGTDHWMTEGGEVGARFGEVINCGQHTMFASMQMRDANPESEDGDNSFVLAFSNCSINEGKTFEDVSAAQGEWNAYADENGFAGNSYVLWPIWGENVAADYDFKFVGSAADFSALGAHYQLMADGHWRKNEEIWGGLLDCDSSRIYASEVIREMAEE